MISPTRFVIADDDLSVLRQWSVFLRNEGYIAAAAQNGSMALKYVHRYVPEVAILDIWMPSLDGFEVTRKIRESHLRTAVVICSIETDAQFVEAAQEAGALGYVFKYTAARDLVRAVKLAALGQSFVSAT